MTAVAGLALLFACGDPLSIGIFAVEVDGIVVVSPTEQEEFRVTAINRRTERVVWGSGSSSCQFGLVVEDASGTRHNIDFRVCTRDLVEQGLDPGASRIEKFLWGGTIVADQETQPLPPGQYRVIGVAGQYESAPLVVTVLIP
jgi:hypothetical protein